MKPCDTEYVCAITTDEQAFQRLAPQARQECETALTDLLAQNRFAPECIEPLGPYRLNLRLADHRLFFILDSEQLAEPREVMIALRPFRRIIRDYFMIFESHLEAVNQGQYHRIEAIDMARRGIHNEGAELLMEQLADRISLDFDTARRLFTLLCGLHTKQQ